MERSQQRSRYEERLSRAHRALYWAAEAAEAMGDPGAQEDCIGLQGEVSRLMDDSLRMKRRPRRQQQLQTEDAS